MFRKLSGIGVVMTAMLISLGGCSVASLVPGGLPVPGPISDSDAGTLALSSYTKTYAGGSKVDVTEEQKNGMMGFAAANSTPSSALTNTSGTFTTAKVTLAADELSLKIEVDGETFTLPNDYQNYDTGGKKYIEQSYNGHSGRVYLFGVNTTGQLTNAELALLYNGKYASLAAFMKDVNGTAEAPSPGGYSFIATGLETSANAIPVQIVSYGGYWGIFVPGTTGGSSAGFDATVNFNTKSMSYTAYSFDGTSGSGTATITGNQFEGDIALSGFTIGNKWESSNGQDWECTVGCKSLTGSGRVIGAFYGPAAEEVAGVTTGTTSVNGSGSSDFGGFFIGSKSP